MITIAIEDGHANWYEIEPLYKMHYGEMEKRRIEQNINISPYNPRLDQYFKAFDEGWLLNFVVRKDGEAIAYSNVYVTNDMHNQDKIGQEDAIFVHPDHRGRIGRQLTKFVLAELKKRGVIRATISTAIDLRQSAIWRRLGFSDTATVMTYSF